MFHLGGSGLAQQAQTPPGVPLPCLYSNNSIETIQSSSDQYKVNCVEAVAATLTPYHKRQAHTLFSNVERLISKVAKSINHVGFLTLTFEENITDFKEASRRFNSLKTNFLSKYPEFGEWLCVKEQQNRGAWHFHLIICMEKDIKKGVDFKELAKGKYKSASPYLRKVWADLREAMPKYGFGRSELLPIRSNAEAMGRYVGKYVSKHISQRNKDNKGARLVTSSRGWVKNSVHFGWVTKNAKLWRMKLKMFATLNGCTELYQLTEKLGPGWAYKFADDIYSISDQLDNIIKNKDKKYEPHIVKTIQRRKEKRDISLKQNLTLHTKKSKYVLVKEKAREKIASIKNEKHVRWWTSWQFIIPEQREEIEKRAGEGIQEYHLMKIQHQKDVEWVKEKYKL